MKYRQIRKLLKIMSTTKWKIINKGEIRLKVNCSVCPLTYCASMVSNKQFRLCEYKQAARELDINTLDAYRIANVADSDLNSGNKERKQLRRIFLKLIEKQKVG